MELTRTRSRFGAGWPGCMTGMSPTGVYTRFRMRRRRRGGDYRRKKNPCRRGSGEGGRRRTDGGLMRRLMIGVPSVVLMIAASGVVAQTSSGTAFAVAPGLLITNQHVIDGCSSVEVISVDGRRTGSVVDADDQIDLALLRVSGIKGATARLRSPRNIRLGESVMVFGFPLAGSLTSGGNFTSGLVSGLRGLRDAAGELQITAPVQPGNSGGPLMDASGLVIGVVQAKLDALRSAIATGDIPQNVNVAISLDVLADFLAKNKVAFRDGSLSAPLDTARVAALAQNFTHRVECRRRSQQTVAPREAPKPAPNVPATRPPPPLGSIAAMTRGSTFRDCDICPEMVVIPAGSFTMGSPASEAVHNPNEGPQHQVTISRPFAAGKYEVTFDEWDACTRDGLCAGYVPPDQGWGRGRRPVINVSWQDAKQYTAWLSGKTNRSYPDGHFKFPHLWPLQIPPVATTGACGLLLDFLCWCKADWRRLAV